MKEGDRITCIRYGFMGKITEICNNDGTTRVRWDGDDVDTWVESHSISPVGTVQQSPLRSSKERYMEFHQEFCNKMMTITKAKNADYTGTLDNPFANFTRVEDLGICSTEQGFLTRMTDKLCRITSFVQQGTLQVKDESVQDTLNDLANYCALFSGYLESKKQE